MPGEKRNCVSGSPTKKGPDLTGLSLYKIKISTCVPIRQDTGMDTPHVSRRMDCGDCGGVVNWQYGRQTKLALRPSSRVHLCPVHRQATEQSGAALPEDLNTTTLRSPCRPSIARVVRKRAVRRRLLHGIFSPCASRASNQACQGTTDPSSPVEVLYGDSNLGLAWPHRKAKTRPEE